jgi:hypothetical protein
MIVHRFPGNTSAEVYAFTQTSDAVKDGDVLVVPDEHVVGVLIGAWPVAVSDETGAFHPTQDGFDWSQVEWAPDTDPRDYTASHDAARAEILQAWDGEPTNSVVWGPAYAACA